MYLVGITGSIATGKSRLAQWLRDRGYAVIDADSVTHEILEEDDDLWAHLVQHFGDEILDPEGAICRSCLARLVFADPAEKNFLEDAIHPLIIKELLHRAHRFAGRRRHPIVFIEATLIFQTGFDRHLDDIWLLTTPLSEQRRRLTEERHYSPDEADLRLTGIAPLSAAQRARCRHIDNSRDFNYTTQQAEQFLEQALRSARENK